MREYVEIDGDVVPEGSVKDSDGNWYLEVDGMRLRIHPFPMSLSWSDEGWVPT